MNKILLEEIKRFNLLSKYDNKNTLTENVKKHNIGLLLEQGIFKDLLRIFGGEERLIAKELQNVFKETDIFFSTTGKELKTGEELFTALREGRLAGKEMAKVNKSLLKNGSTLEIKTAAADNFAKNPAFAELMNLRTDDEIIKGLMGPPGYYSKSDAELLLNRFNKSGNRIRPGGGVSPVKPNEITPNTGGGGKPPITGNKTKIQKIKDTIKNTKNWVFAKRWRKIAVIGGAIGLWLWLTSDDDSPFPACLAAKIPQSEFDKMKDETPDYLLVKTTGNKEIDSYGGGKFYTNGDFKFGNDSMSGKWEESTDKVTITVGSKTYELSCQEVPQDNSGGGGIVPPPPPTDEDASITFTDCDKFPFKLGCINNKIKDVQDCLNVPKTGKFDTKTKNALKDKGYGETITQEIYNTIMTKCGKLDKVENDYKYLMSTGGQSRTDY